MTKVPKKKGLAAMTPERRREIAALGGKAVPSEKRGFSNRELASKAGRIGGKMTKAEARPFSIDRELAARAGRKGSVKVQKEKAKSRLPRSLAIEKPE